MTGDGDERPNPWFMGLLDVKSSGAGGGVCHAMPFSGTDDRVHRFPLLSDGRGWEFPREMGGRSVTFVLFLDRGVV